MTITADFFNYFNNTPEDKKFLEKEYGGVSQGVGMLCLKERSGQDTSRYRSAKKQGVSLSIHPKLSQLENNGLEQNVTLPKKIIMRECGVQERTAVNYIKQLITLIPMF